VSSRLSTVSVDTSRSDQPSVGGRHPDRPEHHHEHRHNHRHHHEHHHSVSPRPNQRHPAASTTVTNTVTDATSPQSNAQRRPVPRYVRICRIYGWRNSLPITSPAGTSRPVSILFSLTHLCTLVWRVTYVLDLLHLAMANVFKNRRRRNILTNYTINVRIFVFVNIFRSAYLVHVRSRDSLAKKLHRGRLPYVRLLRLSEMLPFSGQFPACCLGESKDWEPLDPSVGRTMRIHEIYGLFARNRARRLDNVAIALKSRRIYQFPRPPNKRYSSSTSQTW